MLPTAFAQTGGSPDGTGETADRPPDDKPPEKTDPNDLRNSIGNLNLIRGVRDLTPPPPPGLWQEIVNRPYYPPPVKAQKLLFHGQYAQAEAAYNALLKDAPANQEYIENQLDAILQEGRSSDIRRFNDKLAALDEKQKTTPKIIRLQGQALAASGKYAEARALFKSYTEAHPKP